MSKILFSQPDGPPIGPSKSTIVSLRASAKLGGSNAWSLSGPVECVGGRNAELWISYTAGAIGGFPNIIPYVASTTIAPVAADYYIPPVTDGVITEVDVSGEPTATGFTGRNMGQISYRDLLIKALQAADNTSPQRIVIPVRLGCARWFAIDCQEGSGVAVGTLAVSLAFEA